MELVKNNLEKTNKKIDSLKSVKDRLMVWLFKKPDRKNQIIRANEIINEGLNDIFKKLNDVI